MDLGAFGVDQELEQADRLQQQALQLLQHAGSAHTWSPTTRGPSPPPYATDKWSNCVDDAATCWYVFDGALMYICVHSTIGMC